MDERQAPGEHRLSAQAGKQVRPDCQSASGLTASENTERKDIVPAYSGDIAEKGLQETAPGNKHEHSVMSPEFPFFSIRSPILFLEYGVYHHMDIRRVLHQSSVVPPTEQVRSVCHAADAQL